MYQKKIKENNEKKVFHYIYQKRENLSIADISNDLNISFPTIKTIVNKFLKENIIREDLKIGNGAGRKAQYYSLENNFVYSIGIAIHLKELKIILGNERGDIIKETIIKENFLKENLIERIDEVLEEFLLDINEQIEKKLIGIGISIPGIVDTENNTIEITPLLRISLNKVKNLSEKYNKKILIDNEANLCAISEKFLGIGKEFSNFIILNIGDSLNMSTFTEEDDYGNFSFKASRVNHMSINFQGVLCDCGNRGCWGKYASEIALLDRFKKIDTSITRVKDIFKNDYLIDEEYHNFFDEYIEYLSIGIKNIIFLYNPEKIIISGKLSKYKNYFKKELVNKIYNNSIFFKGKETIEFSGLEEKGVYLGAAMLPIIDELF
ncbi:ROK family protein [Cetobacterium somerae]